MSEFERMLSAEPLSGAVSPVARRVENRRRLRERRTVSPGCQAPGERQQSW
jgi:hypothetical protein